MKRRVKQIKMLDYKESTTEVIYGLGAITLDYSEKSILIFDLDCGSWLFYPKSKIVVNHDIKSLATINNVYRSSLEFTKRNFSHSYFENVLEKGYKTFDYSTINN